jgi:hypothetical protein
MAFFPLFPWLAYALAGCAIGGFWIRASHENRLPKALLASAILGAAMAIAGQLLRLPDWTLFPAARFPVTPTSPTSFFYRTGVCIVGASVAYLAVRAANPARFSPLQQLGKTSLLVYWVHVELVYGHASRLIKQRLSLPVATTALVALTAAMVAISWLRTERFSRRPPRPLGSAQKSGV